MQKFFLCVYNRRKAQRGVKGIYFFCPNVSQSFSDKALLVIRVAKGILTERSMVPHEISGL